MAEREAGTTGPVPSILATLGLALVIFTVNQAAPEGASESDGEVRRACRSLSWRGHSISAIAWSPDGRRLAASGWGHGVRIWEPGTGIARTREPDDGEPRFVLGWPDGAEGPTVGDLDGRVETWDQPGALPVEDLGTASASRGCSIRLWGQEDRRSEWFPAVARSSNSFACSPDGRLVASAGRDGVVRVWEVGSEAVLHAWSTDGIGINCVAFSPDGATLAAGGGGPIRIWEVANGRLRATLGDGNGGFSSLAFSADGRSLAGATWGGKIHAWDLATSRERATFRGHGRQVLALAWSPDGSRLASGGHDATVRIWELPPAR